MAVVAVCAIVVQLVLEAPLPRQNETPRSVMATGKTSRVAVSAHHTPTPKCTGGDEVPTWEPFSPPREFRVVPQWHYAAVNLRSGPGEDYPRIGEIQRDRRAVGIGRARGRYCWEGWIKLAADKGYIRDDFLRQLSSIQTSVQRTRVPEGANRSTAAAKGVAGGRAVNTRPNAPGSYAEGRYNSRIAEQGCKNERDPAGCMFLKGFQWVATKNDWIPKYKWSGAE